MVRVRVGVRRLAGVEEADDVDAQVALQPLQRGVGAVHDLGDARVGEDLVERVAHGAVQRDRVDQEVLVARADLDERDEAWLGLGLGSGSGLGLGLG